MILLSCMENERLSFACKALLPSLTVRVQTEDVNPEEQRVTRSHSFSFSPGTLTQISHGWSVMRGCRCVPSSLCFCQFICSSWIISSSLSALSCCTSSTSCYFTAAVLLQPQVTLFLRSYTLVKRHIEQNDTSCTL